MMRPMMMGHLVLAAAIGVTAAGVAEAGIVLTATEGGGNVVISGGGTADLTGLTGPFSDTSSSSALSPFPVIVVVGPTSTVPIDVYEGVAGSMTLGSGRTTILATTGEGDRFGVSENIGGAFFLALPQGYLSGAMLSGSCTFRNQSFASLGVTPGTYVWSWDGDAANSLVLQVGPSSQPVPEPSAFVLAGAGGIGLFGSIRLRKRA
jgi:hypothetical protein